MSKQVLVRIYDDRSDTPQPQGPVALDVPEGAVTDAEIVQEIRRQWVDPTRPATVEWNEGGGGSLGGINRGWAVRYDR